MFKKTPAIKAVAPLRSSDRRKTADKIIQDFHVEIPKSPDTPDDKDGIPESANQPTLASIRNALLPENTQSAKFTTTAGPDLKVVSGTVYIGSYTGDDQRILWYRIDEQMYPTVYTLWRNPGLVPLLHTPDFVVHEKLQTGADLMTPGLAGPPFPSRATKGSLVAVASLQKPTVPLVVGSCEIDIASLKTAKGEKGRAVRVLHWQGDELWSWSIAGRGGAFPPDHIDGWDQKAPEQLVEVQEGLGELALKAEEDGGVALTKADIDTSSSAAPDKGTGSEEHKLLETSSVEDVPLTTKEIDEAFRKAFLYGVYQHMHTNKTSSTHGLVFPLNSSFIMSELILPFLPTFTPAQTASLQIKKTSWKNLKKFIKAMEKEQLLKSKDRNGGELVVLDIDFAERAFKDFTPYPLPRKEVAGGGKEGSAPDTAASSGGDPSVGQHLRRLVFYKPKEKLAPIFEPSKSSVRDTYSASELRSIVVTYLEAESLIVPTNKRLVKLNPVLSNAVFDTASSLDNEVMAKGTVPRDILIDRVLTLCTSQWAILRGDQSKDEVRPKTGAVPSVNILLETRSGNKVVTKLSGVEAYFIHPQPLAEELQKVCASATSVSQLIGSSPKNPVMEILVQGPQRDAVMKALEKRGVNRQWISVIDKTKGKKR